MDPITSLAQEIYNLKSQKEILDNEIKAKKASSDELDALIAEKSAQLLIDLDATGSTTLEVDDIIAAKFSKKSIEYISESAALKALKDNGYIHLIKVKVAESLDKTAIKKAMKADAALSQILQDVTTEKVTEYVVVTSKENYSKMVEHIENGK